MKLQLTASKGFTKPKTKKGGSKPKESASQAAVIEWAQWESSRYPELRFLCAIPNGFPLGGLPEKLRYSIAQHMKAQGLKKGAPDLILPAARGSSHALFIEMKTDDGDVSPEQAEFIEYLNGNGYSALVCRSSGEAINAISLYLRMPRTLTIPFAPPEE